MSNDPSNPGDKPSSATSFFRLDIEPSLRGLDPAPKPVVRKNVSSEVPEEQRMKLVGVSAVVQGQQWVLDKKEFHIGRAPENEIAIEHPSVSDFHARLVFEDGHYVLADMGSETGIRVNLESFGRFVLAYNDLVQVGAVRFRFIRPREVINTEGGSVSVYIPRENKAKVRRRKRLIVMGAVVFLAIVAGLVGPQIFRTNTIVHHRKDEGLTEEQLMGRLESARQAFAAEKWEEARVTLEQIRVATEDRQGSVRTQTLNYLDRVGREQAASDIFNKIKALQDAGNLEAAVAAYQSAGNSLQDTRAERRLSELGPQLRQAAVDALLAQAREAIKDHKLDAAQGFVARVMEIDPKNAGAVRFKEALARLSARASGRGAGSAQGQAAAGGSGDADEGDEVARVAMDRELSVAFAGSGDAPVLGANAMGRGPSSTGHLSQDQVEATVAQHSPEIRWCYQQAIERNPDLRGKVVVQFTVQENGSIAGVQLRESTVGVSELEQCVQNKVRRWKFPQPQGGQVVVTYPFAFEAIH